MKIDEKDPQHGEKTRLREKYAEFLSLPLAVDYHNPLTFVVAHRHHGRQMRTGWDSDAQSLQDRHDENNNILIETRSSNFFKWHFAESTYPVLKQMLGEVDIPLSIANPDLELSAVDSRFESGEVVIEYKEEDDVEDVLALASAVEDEDMFDDVKDEDALMQ